MSRALERRLHDPRRILTLEQHDDHQNHRRGGDGSTDQRLPRGLRQEPRGENGERRYTGLEPEYYPTQIAWLREHN